jgi:hypothetical protein
VGYKLVVAATLPIRHPFRSARVVVPRPARAPRAPKTPMEERPLWQTIALLYAAVALVVCAVLALAFVIPWLVTGSPY